MSVCVCVVHVRQLLNMSAITTRMDDVTWPHAWHADAGTTTSMGHNPLAYPTGRDTSGIINVPGSESERWRQTRNGILWRVIGIYSSSSCCRCCCCETCAYAYTHTYSNYTHTDWAHFAPLPKALHKSTESHARRCI